MIRVDCTVAVVPLARALMKKRSKVGVLDLRVVHEGMDERHTCEAGAELLD